MYCPAYIFPLLADSVPLYVLSLHCSICGFFRPFRELQTSADHGMVLGFPELHTLLDLLATRVWVAQEEEIAWRGCTAAPPAYLLLRYSRAQPCKENGRNGYTKKPC